MVTIATAEMTEALKQLWQMGFGDTEEYTNMLFREMLSPERILVYKDKADHPIAMLCMEEMTLVSGEYSKKGVYVYGFNVHPRFRSRGVGAKLLEEFHVFAKAKGYYASVLTPATKELFDYYESRGYTTQFAVRQLRISPELIVPTGRECVLVSRSLDNLSKMRKEFFGGSNLLIDWSPSYLHFVTKEVKLRGGSVLLAKVGKEKGYIVYRVENGEAIITEFAVPPSVMDDVLATLHLRVNADRYKIRLSADYGSREGSMVLPFAMIKWYDKLKVDNSVTLAPYISHVMD